MDKLNAVLKVLSIVLIIGCLLYFGGKFLVVRYLSKNTVYEVKSINTEVYDLAKKYLEIDLPDSASIVNISLESWRDDVIYLELKVKTNEVSNVEAQIKNNVIEPQITKNGVTWWNLTKKDIDKVISRNIPPSTYYFIDPKNGFTSIFIEVWIQNRLSKNERELFE